MRKVRTAGRTVYIDPSTRDEERWERCRLSLKDFCETYFAAAFYLGWSEDHLRVINQMQQATLEGGLFAYAMPRGSGKTTISRIAATWALLYAHVGWVCLIGATEGHAKKLLESIQKDLTYNPMLIDDFPAICQPIAALQNDARRASGQLYMMPGMEEAEKTEVDWKADQMVLPTISGEPASGGRISVCGLTGNIRGQVDNLLDGRVVRPELIFLDDPQTKRSAASPTQNNTRYELLTGDILGLAGPDVDIKGLMACTVIYPDDMADRVLDRKRTPQWRGVRTKLVYQFPDDLQAKDSLWEQYANIRGEDMEEGGDGSKATDFYNKHRKKMDAGSFVAWPERHPPRYLSAIEYAMVLRFDRPETFAAEYQNEPEVEIDQAIDLRADTFREKHAETERGLVPRDLAALTAFIDVQDKLLYYVVMAWRQGFGGTIVDYGAWPEQKAKHFTYRTCRRTLKRSYKGTQKDAHIYQGLTDLTDHLTGQPWPDQQGRPHKLDRVLIDSGDGEHQGAVFRVCREHDQRSILMPSRGIGISAKRAPMSDWSKKKGERAAGHHWRDRPDYDAGIRYLLIDVNYWKADARRRMAMGQGAAEGIELYKAASASHHRMIAEHVVAEIGTAVEADGRRVIEFVMPPAKPDNHLFDCVVGCAAAASHVGLSTGQETRNPRKRRRRKGGVSKLSA